MGRIEYLCPETRAPLSRKPRGLSRADGRLYPFLRDTEAAVFQGDAEATPDPSAAQIYRNFLAWLFATVGEIEEPWRRTMAARLNLKPGQTVLVTGCGLGDDLAPLIEAVGPTGEVHAQDLSPDMVRDAAARFPAVRFSVGDALHLPFADAAFDAAFHFGGINLFGDVGAALSEMARVVRSGGRVLVSDEGVAPWLRDTEFGHMAIANNPLWGLPAPFDKLPPTAADVSVEWVLGQCFWVIGFSVAPAPPALNPHVPHKSPRGGTMWTRYQAFLADADADQSSSTARPKPVRP